MRSFPTELDNMLCLPTPGPGPQSTFASFEIQNEFLLYFRNDGEFHEMLVVKRNPFCSEMLMQVEWSSGLQTVQGQDQIEIYKQTVLFVDANSIFFFFFLEFPSGEF